MYKRRHVQCPFLLSLVRLYLNLVFLYIFSTNIQLTNSIRIRPVGAELFHADGRTDKQTTTNTRTLQYCERA
jgi:hypothetical protein